MRKYLIAALTGLVLLGGQAAASENAIGGVDNRLGGGADERVGVAPHGQVLVALFVGGVIALSVWGLTQHGSQGSPASP